MILDRQRKTRDPCKGCGMHRSLCICEFIPMLNLKTKVCLIIHHRELKRPTNTGQLAIRSLVNSEMRIRGLKDQGQMDLSDLLVPTYRTLLFYPSDDAQELNEELVQQSSLPIQLIVPDGNWRQASKVHSRQPELKTIPKVKISTLNTSRYHLRTEHMPEGMSTLEAIASALEIIEGKEAAVALHKLYQIKLEKTLLARGIVL